MIEAPKNLAALEFFIARQPIYNQRTELIGYELLYRKTNEDHANFDDDKLASSSVIIETFIHIGIDSLVGSALAFVHVPRCFITDPSLTPFFEGQLVLEILAVDHDEQFLSGLTRLKKLGHKIALDDFIYYPGCQPLLELADYVKLNVLRHDTEQLREQLKILRRHPVSVIAEKVETQPLHDTCKTLGFDYFQGFFYCYPSTVLHQTVLPNQAVLLKLIQQLQDPNVDLRDLEKILAQDVPLTYKLLRYVNSANFSRRCEINSLQDAILLIGTNKIRDWACLLLLERAARGKPNELIVNSMIRAHMCALLAEPFGPEMQQQMFIVGLFSLIDILLDCAMLDLLDYLGLAMPIKLALLEREGIQGELLQQAIEYEQGYWDSLTNSVTPNSKYIDSYLKALMLTNEAMKIIASTRQ